MNCNVDYFLKAGSFLILSFYLKCIQDSAKETKEDDLFTSSQILYITICTNYIRNMIGKFYELYIMTFQHVVSITSVMIASYACRCSP